MLQQLGSLIQSHQQKYFHYLIFHHRHCTSKGENKNTTKLA
ncbi:hypothetical protein MtrunA17_Chr5g0407371 [Medicago truncatula]|uniref:Uncharacterized protein n=1 Tax=Medicago truncatula TaxID=3880 RepID=A0A396HRF1_MEDTR|nr:hypothetical protein MtrunA17_Chr5g0407371 [Medicago truncatula]